VQLHEARQLLDEVLGTLGDELRSVFVLAELEERSVREIAELEGVPQGTVRSRLRTARAKFRGALERRCARDRLARTPEPGPGGVGAPFHAGFYGA
jgi:RNA polymerase sigma-70 factor (ECF subfamily)